MYMYMYIGSRTSQWGRGVVKYYKQLVLHLEICTKNVIYIICMFCVIISVALITDQLIGLPAVSSVCQNLFYHDISVYVQYHMPII